MPDVDPSVLPYRLVEGDPRELLHHPLNWGVHSPEQKEALRHSVARHGSLIEPIVNRRTGRIIDGHLRVEDAVEKGQKKIVYKEVDVDEVTEAEMLLNLDHVSELRERHGENLGALLLQIQTADVPLSPAWDENALALLEEARKGPPELDPPSGDGEGHTPGTAGPGALLDRCIMPPFSVFDTRQGYWVQRKKAWLSLGIASEIGRGENLLSMGDFVLAQTVADVRRHPEKHAEIMAQYRQQAQDQEDAQRANEGLWVGGVQGKDPTFYQQMEKWKKANNRDITTEEFRLKHWVPRNYRGTSIFDPVLCEIVYRWFCPPGGTILDPFAGGSVRGVVAGYLGFTYHGVDLRADQVTANRQQAEAIGPDVPPTWHVGNSLELETVIPEDLEVDLLFSCPPYYDLEQYSEDPADLSNLGTYEEFVVQHKAIIRKAAERLRDNRFAVWVVGDVRDKDGCYVALPAHTIEAFEECGFRLLNYAVLLQPLGSLPIRVAKQFERGRKLGKCHQDVLIFYRGDPTPSAIVSILGSTTYGDPFAGAICHECGGDGQEGGCVLCGRLPGDADPEPLTEEELAAAAAVTAENGPAPATAPAVTLGGEV